MKTSPQATISPTVFEWAHDLNGCQWSIIMDKELAPSARRPDLLSWHVTMFAETSIDQSGLIDSGVLDRRRDARLLGLLGQSRVKVRTPAVRFEVSAEKQIGQIAGEASSGIKKALLNRGIVDLKKQSVAQRVEANCRFGPVENY